MSALRPEDHLRDRLKRDYREINAALSAEGLSLRDFQQPSTGYSAAFIAVLWICLIALATLWVTGDAWMKVTAFVGFGFVGHAFQLIMHEASHNSLLPNRRWNDAIGNVFAALPAGHTVESYRASHFLHHKYVNLDLDPTGFISRPNLTRKQVWMRLISLLLGRPVVDLAIRAIRGNRADRAIRYSGREAHIAAIERRRLLKVAAFHAPFLILALLLGHGSLWFAWVLSTVSVSTFIDGLRVVVEHKAAPRDRLGFHTRSHHVSKVLSSIISPMFQYHWEHHVVPSVPHYQLRRLHKILVKHGVRQAIPPRGGAFGAFYSVMLS